MRPGLRYRLSSVIEHIGRGIDTGHYMAYCYDEDTDTWLLYDDARVQPVAAAQVERAQAYLLVYERVPAAAAVADK
jgi:ubiquitin C-terminal hydrolase